MSMIQFAEDELRRAGLFDDDSDYGGMMGESVLALVRQFADQGHSGFSASMAVSLFEKLSRFQPITPLTGNEDEWGEPYDDEGTRQNKRCPHVFMGANGVAYDSNGRVFREPGGACYTNRDSFVSVTFPYTPTTEYVNVPDSAETNEGAPHEQP